MQELVWYTTVPGSDCQHVAASDLMVETWCVYLSPGAQHCVVADLKFYDSAM